jgi:hypothetical protein
MLGLELAGGFLVFVVFSIVLLVAVTLSLYTRTGSAIAQHPYHHPHGGAPAAAHESRMTGSADREVLIWTRGTR